MRKLLCVLSFCFLFLFSSCSFVEQFKRENSHPVERVLCISGDMHIFIDPLTNIWNLYAYVGETITFTYNYAPDNSYNCETFDVEVTDPDVFEVIEKSVENKQFKVKVLNPGSSSVKMIPYPDIEDKNSTTIIDVYDANY